MDKIQGSCLCGGVRFETDAEPAFQILCYCNDCQVVSGAEAYAAYVVPIGHVQLLEGELAEFSVTAESGNTNTRRFCTRCGSRVWAELPEMAFASVNGMSLPHGHFKPQGLHRKHNAPDWCVFNEEIPPFPPES